MTTPEPLRPTQAEAAAALIRDCFAELRVDPPPSALKESADSVARQLATGGGFGIAQDGALLAVVLFREEAGGLYLGRLAVAPAARGQGLARALLAAVEAEALRRGLPRVHLGVRLALASNRRLFASAGFTEGRLHAHEGYAQPTWVEMEKWL